VVTWGGYYHELAPESGQRAALPRHLSINMPTKAYDARSEDPVQLRHRGDIVRFFALVLCPTRRPALTAIIEPAALPKFDWLFSQREPGLFWWPAVSEQLICAVLPGSRINPQLGYQA
jgi:hypothetical protein